MSGKNKKKKTVHKGNIKILPLTVFILSLTAMPALSFDSVNPVEDYRSTRNVNLIINVSRETLQHNYSLPSSAEESCLSLLNMQHFKPNFNPAEGNRRTAGIATLGALLGIRLALEHSGTRTLMLSMHNKSYTVFTGRNAEVVTAYRLCEKNEALNAIKDKKAEL